MKILISQEEYVKKTRSYDALERAYYDFLDGHEIIPLPNLIKVPDIDYDCLILTGGPDSISRNQTENLMYDHAVSKGVPVIGICHGAFAIADINSSDFNRISGHVDADIKITMEGKKHTVRCYHSQNIKTLSDEFIVTSYDQDGNIHSFQHKVLPIYGIVWHPERMNKIVLPKDVAEILRTNKSRF